MNRNAWSSPSLRTPPSGELETLLYLLGGMALAVAIARQNKALRVAATLPPPKPQRARRIPRPTVD